MGRGQQLGEQVALLVEADALDRDLRENVALDCLPEAVREERVLPHLTWEGVAVHAEQEEVVEAPRASLDHREHLHAAPGTAERWRTHPFERSSHQREELLAGQREPFRQFITERREQLSDRLGACRVAAPTQPHVEEPLEAPQVLRRAGIRGPRLQERHDRGGLSDDMAQACACQATVRRDPPPPTVLFATLPRHLDEAAPHRQRQRAALVQERADVERGHVAQARSPAGVQRQPHVEALHSACGREPTVGWRLGAPAEQIRERARASRGGVDRGEATECRKGDSETREVHLDRRRIGGKVARDDADPLRWCALVQQSADPPRNFPNLGV